ncbi:hypothetical protein [Bacillus sp. FSL K6-6540]|uniref:hypothetical protein n=1 Tax=Bacillus sp. FSL K6-6540 TaxID=2921512 RepID=UPI0030F7FB9C
MTMTKIKLGLIQALMYKDIIAELIIDLATSGICLEVVFSLLKAGITFLLMIHLF